MNRLAFALAAMLAPSAVNAQTSPQGHQAAQRWKVMDVCAKQAQIAFPDLTADSNAKRDAKLKECLSANHLPPRQPLSPP
jgi:hypothetical protein